MEASRHRPAGSPPGSVQSSCGVGDGRKHLCVVLTVALLMASTHSVLEGYSLFLKEPSPSLLFLGCSGGPEWVRTPGDRSLPGLRTDRRPSSAQHPCPPHQAPMSTHGSRRAYTRTGTRAVPLRWLPPLNSPPESPCPTRLNLLNGHHSVTQSSFLGTRHWAKCFLSLNSFSPHSDPTEQRSKPRLRELDDVSKSPSECAELHKPD